MRCRYPALFLVATICGSCSGFADELTVRRQVSSKEMEALVETLIADRQIIADVDVRVSDSETVFDVTSKQNTEELPWVIEVNMGSRKFRDDSKKYSEDGYELSVHRVVSIGRKTLHSAVWVQAASRGAELIVPAGDVPQSGDLGRGWTPLNDLMQRTLQDNNIPGATVAVAYRGKLLYERGFGFADLEKQTTMSPDATMRLASVSKPITAVAVQILAQQGKLELDKPVLDYLAQHPFERFDTEAAIVSDERWKKVTVRHLLQHTGGMDREKSRDTVFHLDEVTRTMKLDRLAGIPDMVRYQLTQPLDFDPGAEYAYSNVGYCLLGRVIEAVTGQTYEAFVQESILNPAGMTRTRLGKSRLKDRATDEVRYYTQQIRKFPAIWDVTDPKKRDRFEMVEEPYGRFDVEVMDAHGGWTSTAADLLRFASAIESESTSLMTPESRQLMQQAPGFPGDVFRTVWYGLGWNVRRVGLGAEVNMWHTGAIAGTSTLLVRRWDGYSWAVLFNADTAQSGKRCAEIIDGPMHAAIDESMRTLE